MTKTMKTLMTAKEAAALAEFRKKEKISKLRKREQDALYRLRKRCGLIIDQYPEALALYRELTR